MSKAPLSVAAHALLAGVALVLPAMAVAESHPCVAHADPAERLACYDRAFGAPATAAQAAAAEARARQEFGLDNEARRERQPQPEAQVDAIQAVVSAVGTARGGERLLTLDNGQRWLVVERGTRGAVRPGDPVTIRAGALSSHRLVTADGVGLRVRRLR